MLLQQENTQNIIVAQGENFATENRPSLKDVACKTIIRLGYNLIPASIHKKALVKWRAYQEKKVSLSEYQQWLANPWQVSPINWLILTGYKPYSDAPGLVVVDADDQQAIEVVEARCPPTPLTDRDQSGATVFLSAYPRSLNGSSPATRPPSTA